MRSKLVLGWLLLGMVLPAHAQAITPISIEYDEYIVGFTDATPAARQAQIADAAGMVVDRSLRLPQTVVVKLKAGTSPETALARLRAFAEVRYVEPNATMHIQR